MDKQSRLPNRKPDFIFKFRGLEADGYQLQDHYAISLRSKVNKDEMIYAVKGVYNLSDDTQYAEILEAFERKALSYFVNGDSTKDF